MVGFNDVNSWSLTDEEGHVSNNIKVLHIVIEDLSDAERAELEMFIHEMVDLYVEVEKSLVDMLGDQEGLTKEDLKSYIEYLGRLRLFKIGYIGHLEVGDNPVSWMDDMLVAERHGAFFEKRVTDYTHKKLEGSVDYSRYLSFSEGVS